MMQRYNTNQTMDIQDNRPRLTCNDGCSISVQASRTHYSTPRENHPEWHWSRFECVEVGYPEDAQGTRIAMPDDWLGYADNPSAGLRSDVFAWVPVQLVCEWIQAHGGLTCAEPWFEQEPLEFPQSTIHCVWENDLDDAPPAPPEPEATIEQLLEHLTGMGLLWVAAGDGRIALTYADHVGRDPSNPRYITTPEPEDYRTVGEWLAMTRYDIRNVI
jgi:hypothetical protein